MRNSTTRRVRSAPASHSRGHAYGPELVQRSRSGLSIRGSGNDCSHASYSSNSGVLLSMRGVSPFRVLLGKLAVPAEMPGVPRTQVSLEAAEKVLGWTPCAADSGRGRPLRVRQRRIRATDVQALVAAARCWCVR
jgi:hypothetical protein